MTSLVFPDLRVWLALASSIHIHHKQAKRWYESLGDEELVFCRFTQLGLLRLLTTSAVMGPEVLTQRQAWHVYDAFLKDGGARFLHEPRTVEDCSVHYPEIPRHRPRIGLTRIWRHLRRKQVLSSSPSTKHSQRKQRARLFHNSFQSLKIHRSLISPITVTPFSSAQQTQPSSSPTPQHTIPSNQ
jgi:predicted nucleic acid-binding protein